jgi:hypothetical protein
LPRKIFSKPLEFSLDFPLSLVDENSAPYLDRSFRHDPFEEEALSMKQFRSLLICLTVFAALTPKVIQAQLSPNETVYATGFNGPRGLKFGPDGLLYVAEAGTGGSTTTIGVCDQVPAPIGPYHGRNTATISKIDRNGNRVVVATGFPSGQDSLPSGDTEGLADIAFLEGALYAVSEGGGCGHGNPDLPNAIYRVNPATGQWKVIANLSAFVKDHPAKYINQADFEPDGVFYSLIAHDGKL